MGKLAVTGRLVAGTVGCLLIAVWVVLWSGGTLYFDGVFVRTVAANLRATEWPTTTGTVLYTHLREERDSEGGRTHWAEVLYAYEVQGHHYSGDKCRPAEIKGLGSLRPKDFVALHPAGARVTVHYNSFDPAQAALDVGVGPAEGLFLMFLMPFNAIMLTAWVAIAAWATGRWRAGGAPAVAGGVRLIHDGPRVRVRLPRVSPFAALLGTFLATTFAGVFLAGFGSHAISPAVAVGAAWALALGCTAAVFARVARRVWSGQADLVIDPLRKRITLPQTYGRREPLEVPFADVKEVAVVERVSRDSDGPTYTYEPTLRCVDPRAGYVKDAVLAKWRDRAKAEAFAAWLRERLGVREARTVPAPEARARPVIGQVLRSLLEKRTPGRTQARGGL